MMFDFIHVVPLYVFQCISQQGKRFPDMFAEIGLQQRENEIPLSHTASLDDIWVALPDGIHNGLLTPFNGL